MENIPNDYEYKPLDPAKNEIRLLELYADGESSQIRARLFSHSLDDISIYDALSYTWGDPGTTKAIELDGDKTFHIFASLEQTLKDIRSEDKSLVIWVDAICIDQRNASERNNQVTMMKMIYEKALLVHIWIDVDVDLPAPLREKLEEIKLGTPLDAGDDPTFWDPVLHVFDQRYWSRVWIHQEVACAAELLLHCRRTTAPVLGLLTFAYQMTKSWNASDARIEWVPLYKSIGNFRGRLLLELRYLRLVQSRHLEHRIGHEFRSHLLSLLNSTRQLGCQNPRDRVYGIMHLAQDFEYGAIQVDYELSVAAVYCSVPRYFVESYERYGPSGCLSFLCLVTSESLGSVHGLPSWCPDWSSPKPASIVTDMRVSDEDPPFIPVAGQVRGKRPWFSHDGQILHAQGFCLETVSAMCLESMTDLIEGDLPVSEILAACLAMMADEDDQLPAEMDANNFCLPLLRSLIAGQEFAEAESAWAELIELSKDPVMSTISLDSSRPLLSKNVLELLSSLALAGNDRTPFRGDGGSIGLIPKEALFYDQVWILFDCPVPVVMRPLDDCYEVVGVAYIDGFMHGEACLDMPQDVSAEGSYGGYEIATVQIK
ncbi:hypothetical protein QTJ16_003638 [Diplocarpon rosae]|uniref:Heterokaryon incompatibility domain-containing protein n=1 Tax=Diplocarpon rosae TaxID=946125 RepID=A0AAD9WDT0_9HELO|nr:hypothetical protein QTJ16_003638 [Diplocarpon rosae]